MADNLKIVIGDDISGLKIYEIINKYFGEHYTGWMKAWYDINDEYAAWFPTITKTDEKPGGSYGGRKTHSNTLSTDGQTILEINHDDTEAPKNDENIKYDKRRFVFGRIDGKFQFLGIFERSLVEDAEFLTYRHERIALGADLSNFELIDEGRTGNVTEWFISGNPKKYDLINAFHDLGKVDWKQSTNVEEGDIVYIYVSADYQQIMFKCKVNKANIEEPDIDDSEYDLSGEYDGSYGRYMELEPIDEFDTELFSRQVLQNYGFSSPQSPVRVTPKIKDYLDLVQELLNAEEMDPDKHDGCYEFMREIVKSYATLSDYSQIDYKDLNLVYFSCIGSWTYGFDKKKRDIMESHLPQFEKNRLLEVIDSIQEKAKNGAYENREAGNPTIGMFGSGFKSFISKVSGSDSPHQFIELCVDILSMDDDNAIFDRAEQVINSSFKGMGAASASVTLHTLKPFVFPIINGNASNGNVFDYLGVDLKRPGDIGTYIENCRKIKDFRDTYFNVKNYRIYDRAIWKIGKGVKTQIDYIGVLDYLENNRGIAYSNPETENDETKKEELLEIKAMGQSVVSELKAMYELCKERFNLDKCETISWLDGSNTKTRQYLWVQMKYKDYGDRPESISILVDMSEVTDRARYRFSLNLKNDGSNKDVVANYHRHLDLPLPDDGSLLYVSGSNEYGRPMVINEDQETIRAKIANGEYKKVQVCSIAEWNEGYSNDDYEQAMLSGVEKLIPYYEHVLGIEGTPPKEEFWPFYEEYPVDITKDEWKQFIEDVEFEHKGCMRVLKCYLDIGGIASPKKMSEIYKGHPTVYTSSITNTSKRALNYFDMEPCQDKDTQWLFPIICQGHKGKGDDEGTYIYKIREELLEALKEIDLSDIELEYKKGTADMETVQFDHNLILYGPPGTGKTYNTVNYAVAICDSMSLGEVIAMGYDAAKARYDELVAEGRVAFTTFHQSYGYEEFIEGIKPVLSDEEKSDIGYKVEPGVFKKFCADAQAVEVKNAGIDIPADAQIWKVTVRREVKEDCFTNNRVRIDWGMEDEGANGFVNGMRKGDIIITTDGSRREITGIAVVDSDDAYVLDGEENDTTTRDVTWLAKNINQDITGINNGKMLHRMTCARVLDMLVSDIVALAVNSSDTFTNTEIIENDKPHVFIIDEINRGNISKIFGELITLIEDTKRKGMPEEMSVTLPYSNQPFSVPQNVYILGTMNTADRSIALMDTALRRRFEFEEMMPDSEVIKGIVIDGLDVAAMLDKINDRIEYLFDREHTIGHAFFTKLRENPTIEALASVFRKDIIPLLQEYFYEDYGKIQLVLGDNDKPNEYKFILDEPIELKSLFKGNPDIDVAEDNKYRIQEEAFLEIESYKRIM